MRYEFLTFSDLAYAPRALALYESLTRVCADFRLRLFCVDDATKAVFDELSPPRLRAISMSELEGDDPDLLSVRPTRTTPEYCWTAKASAVLSTFRREPDVDTLTYVDADLMFFHDPRVLFDELADGSILIVPQRHPARLRWWDRWGIYNAGLISFRREESALAALRWWRERCLEWCHARLEDGKYADQTYPDDWPTRFPGARVLAHPGGGVAPWNVTEHVLDRGADGSPTVDGSPLVFYHFASLRLYRDVPGLRRVLPRPFRFTNGPLPLLWTIDRSYAPVSPRAQELVWDPYVRLLSEALTRLPRTGERPEAGVHPLGLVDVVSRGSPRVVVRYARRAAGVTRALGRGPA
jgi:hypothetical protein